MIGKKISHYKIIEKLGEGGMGVVFKAEDTKLKRTVALKFLPPELTRDEESKGRFITEARAASALEHANICNIHSIEETDSGRLFIVMAYYEGETLKKKIERGPSPLPEALSIAMQVADGLAVAHEHGIVHRDIKPANVIVTEEEVAKLLDFGVAKLAGQTGITKTGTTLGTVSYMSPEQARGRKIDNRTDIWSLGVIIYELVTGQPPFRGEYPPAIIYSVLHEQHEPITALRSGVPMELERIVGKCLEKDPADRYHTVSDLRTDLRRLKRDLDTGPTATVSLADTRPRLRFRIPKRHVVSALVAAVSLVVGSLATLGLSYLLTNGGEEETAAQPELVFTQITGGGGLAAFPGWSPDGRWIVYASDEAGNMDIWKKPSEGGQAVQLTSTPDNDIQPAWSPDGRSIAFASDRDGGGIYLIPADGGNPFPVTDFGANPTWSPDSRTIAFDWLGDIYLVPPGGGEPRLLVAGTSAAPFPVWSPDGERLIYWHRTRGDIHVASVADGSSAPLGLIPSGEEVSGLAWSADGTRLYYSRGPFGGNKSLWSVEIDPAGCMPVGDPVALTYSLTDDVQCALSPDGSKLAFSVRQVERHLWACPLDSAAGTITDEREQLTFTGQRNYYPAVSADGRALAWTSHHTASGTLYSMLLEERRERKVTNEWARTTREIGASFAPDGEQICFGSTSAGSYEVWRVPSLGSVALQVTDTEHPVRDSLTAWSPRGDEIAFYSNRSGNWDIWSAAAAGNGQPRRLTPWDSNEMYPCWSPDGRLLAFRTDQEGNADIWVVDAAGENPRPLVVGPAEEGWSSWSPDGRWFYFTSNRTGSFNVWAIPAGGGEAHRVTPFGGLSSGMPESALFTKFAVTPTHLIVPLESRRGDIYILEIIR